MDIAELCTEIVTWLKRMVYSSGGKGAVFGLSGGIDSAVTGALCKRAFPDSCLGIIMPCYSKEIEVEHAKLVAKKLDLPSKIINLDGVFDEMLFSLRVERSRDVHRELAVANIKPRLRMTVLYYFSATMHYRVVGTGNKSEIHIGYFTKYGDGGVDLEPLGSLTKGEVRELARYLGIPEEIIEKKPTAGLWEGQTDEDEMGFTYQELDSYLRGEEVSPAVKEKIEQMHLKSEHKRQLPSIFQKKS